MHSQHGAEQSETFNLQTSSQSLAPQLPTYRGSVALPYFKARAPLPSGNAVEAVLDEVGAGVVEEAGLAQLSGQTQWCVIQRFIMAFFKKNLNG